MKIAYSLAATMTREPATALLLPSSRAADLFDLVERLEIEPLPPVFATADGFLVKLPAPRTTPVAGVVRLRSLANHLYLPVDAELTPPLLPDEAHGLTRSRGLVFLPGPRILEFAAERPIAWESLLRVPAVTTPNWRTLPEPPTLAEGLVELSSTAPPPLVEAILEQGRQDIATESPRPEPAAGMGTQVLGTSLFVVGHTMAWLGTKLGLAGIAGRGADLLQRALDRVPRLSEFLMNQQEAMLRRLLKDFREGRIEEALRRALPLGGPASQVMTPPTSASLPWHNFLHSLENLLGRNNGPASAWFTPDDVFYSLQAEYRKQAEEAARRGDYRRAAFIYAKLLYDVSGAARILSQGGLHRDAAIIYETALNNPRAAAQEWEAAGEIDKAVELLFRLDDHLAAAELLQKVGETDRALSLYRIAAGNLIDQRKYFEAGELLRTKAQREDLALDVFHDGWRTRPLAQANPCGLALASHYSQEPNVARFRELVRDAQTCQADWAAEATVHFFNQIARLVNRPPLATIADETHDRCLMALAAKMTEPSATVRSDRKASLFFPADSPWPAPVARDAQFALEHTSVCRLASGPPKLLGRFGRSTVRAVCRMPLSGDLFLGFENGEILYHSQGTGDSRTVTKLPGPILGLLTDPEEHHLIALSLSPPNIAHVLVGSRSVNFRFQDFLSTRKDSPTRLLGTVENQSSPFFGIISGEDVLLFRRDNPSWRLTNTPVPGQHPRAGLVGTSPDAVPWILLYYEYGVLFVSPDSDTQNWCDYGLEAVPENSARDTLLQPPVVGWLVGPNTVEVHWGAKHDFVYKLRLDIGHPIRFSTTPFPVQSESVPFVLHGCLDPRLTDEQRTELWAALNDQWLKRGHLFNPVAAFGERDGGILVVEADGSLKQIAAK